VLNWELKLILKAKKTVWMEVYDSDPRSHPDAKRFSRLTHQEVFERHLNVMDMTASTLCQENNIDILVFDMNVKGNIKKAANDPSIGTLITNRKE
jgi:uridylate kinase